MTEYPSRCPLCGMPACIHGGHGGPIKRNGWISYECGTRWHKQWGWSAGHSGCLAQRYFNALHKIAHGRLSDRQKLRVAREAIDRGAMLRAELKDI